MPTLLCDDWEPLRHVAMTSGSDTRYTLELYDTGKREGGAFGKCILAYRFRSPAGVLFEGEEYSPGASIAIDSDAAIRGLMVFLCLQPGDVESAYFADYTPEQMAFARSYEAESLYLYTDEEVPEHFEELPLPDEG